MLTLKPLPVALTLGAVIVVAAVAYRMVAPTTADDAGLGHGDGAPGGSVWSGRGGPANGAGVKAPTGDASKVTVSDAMGLTLDVSRLFELGFSGGLVIDRDTRAVIEGVLNSMPEHPSEQDQQRLETTLREGLPREEAERALKLFSAYRGYTHDVREQMESQGIPGNLQQMNAFFDQMESLKQRHFDAATAQALFGDADAHARVTMEAMFVDQDASLSYEQKKQRLDELRAKLPADQQSLIGPPTRPADVPSAS